MFKKGDRYLMYKYLMVYAKKINNNIQIYKSQGHPKFNNFMILFALLLRYIKHTNFKLGHAHLKLIRSQFYRESHRFQPPMQTLNLKFGFKLGLILCFMVGLVLRPDLKPNFRFEISRTILAFRPKRSEFYNTPTVLLEFK